MDVQVTRFIVKPNVRTSYTNLWHCVLHWNRLRAKLRRSRSASSMYSWPMSRVNKKFSLLYRYMIRLHKLTFTLFLCHYLGLNPGFENVQIQMTLSYAECVLPRVPFAFICFHASWIKVFNFFVVNDLKSLQYPCSKWNPFRQPVLINSTC